MITESALDSNVHIAGIIAAGGQGSRLGVAGGKQLLAIAHKPVVAWSIDALARVVAIRNIVVVCDPDRLEEYAQVITDSVSTTKALFFVAGGSTREESVMAGLSALDDSVDVVAIHDGARPLLEAKHVHLAFEKLLSEPELDGVVVGVPAVDTLKQVKDGQIIGTPDRGLYWQAQTPQIFWRKKIVSAYEEAGKTGYQGTDDASYCEQAGGRVSMSVGSRNNIKITSSEDLSFAELMLEAQRKGSDI